MPGREMVAGDVRVLASFRNAPVSYTEREQELFCKDCVDVVLLTRDMNVVCSRVVRWPCIEMTLRSPWEQVLALVHTPIDVKGIHVRADHKNADVDFVPCNCLLCRTCS
jgi:hypothetical protein